MEGVVAQIVRDSPIMNGRQLLMLTFSKQQLFGIGSYLRVGLEALEAAMGGATPVNGMSLIIAYHTRSFADERI